MRGIEYGGTAVEKKDLQDAITGEMVYILAISLCLVVAILLITSESWLEPFILLAASGVAVLLNRETNVMFGEISYITNSIAAILQLALSIDYSIVLLHAYRRQKETTTDTGAAMKAAILSVIKPVSASALTTIAGLLAFLFMSFRIGFDIGIVLMKGIVISAITSLTLLPALVLLDTPIRKAKKKAFVPKGKAFCKTAYKAGKFIVPVALALVVLCGVLQTGNRYIFTDTKVGNRAIVDTFGKNNAVVAVYKNTDDTYANEQQLAQALKAHTTADGTPVLASIRHTATRCGSRTTPKRWCRSWSCPQPIILVAVIQGAIFIAMSTQLLGDGIFFMSYIVTTCILMGATIDYGILMSRNYVAYRQTKDRATALRLSVEAAMPTVYSSGLILTVCGFVIHFISSQNSISTVGLLIGIGTICSVVMITVVLPSVLYLLDAFVLKLSIRKK